ncbi:MAG: hypothetical protein ACR2N9_05560 [Acidimicrobiia bacterium]
MFRRLLPLCLLVFAAASCSSGAEVPTGHENPERAVVAWFEAIDAGDANAASASVHAGSLAVILGIENHLPSDVTAAYLVNGVPVDVQTSYWRSFSTGFSEFASRPISGLTVGESSLFEAEGYAFARVPISGGPSADSIVFTRAREDGSWEVDMVATLADGFSSLFGTAYDDIPSGSDGDTVRAAYVDTIVPAMWAAMADGSFGDDFNRSALKVVNQIEE